MNVTIEDITCECGTVFHWEHDNEDAFFANITRPKHCRPCEIIAEAERDRIHEERLRHEAETKLAEATESAVAQILKVTPIRYQQTDINHPAFNRELWDDINRWRPGDETPFLGLVGVSGACKTRIAYLLFRDIVIERTGRAKRSWSDDAIRLPKFHALTSPEFSQLVGRQFMSSSGPRGSWDDEPKREARRQLDSLRICDVLFLDDLGKAKNTASVAAELFAIIDHRHAHNLPTIWTANSTPEELVVGISEDMSGPLAGRLIECSRIITIK